jgi:hypothetical protein
MKLFSKLVRLITAVQQSSKGHLLDSSVCMRDVSFAM